MDGTVEPPLDEREQLARIVKLEAEGAKLVLKRKLVVPQAILQASLAAAAVMVL